MQLVQTVTAPSLPPPRRTAGEEIALETEQTPAPTRAGTSRRRLWAGRIISGLAVLFLIPDTAIKLVQAGPAVESTAQLGYPASALLVIGLLEALCLVAYLVPRTAVLGALLWTGYLGGAIATHLRLDSPLLSHTLFPIYMALLLWGGLYLRDRRVRALIG